MKHKKILFIVVGITLLVSSIGGGYVLFNMMKLGHYEAGIKAIANGNPNEAKIHFQNAIKKNPEHAESYYELARILETKDLNESLRYLGIAVRMKADYAIAQRRMAQVLFAVRQYKGAEKLVKQVVDAQEEVMLEDYVLLAESMVFRDLTEKGATEDVRIRQQEAFDYLQKAIAMEPTGNKASLSLANMYRVLKQDNKALSILDKAHVKDKRLRQLQLEIMNRPYTEKLSKLMRKEKFQEAAQVAKSRIKRNPDDGAMHAILSDIQYRKGGAKQAIKSLEKAVSMMPDQEPFILRLGAYYKLLNEPKKARDLYKSFIGRQKSERIHYYYLLSFMEEGFDKEHAGLLEAYLEQYPETLFSNVIRGQIQVRKQDFSEAMSFFNKALEINPRLVIARLDYAKALLGVEKFEEAAPVIDGLIQQNPKDQQVLYLHGYIHFRLGATDFDSGHSYKAIKSMTQFLAKNPGHFQARLIRSMLYEKEHFYGKALSDMRYLIKQNPKKAALKQTLRFLQAAQKKHADDYMGAKNILNNMLKTDPENIQAKFKLLQIAKIEGNKKHLKAILEELLKQEPDNTGLKLELSIVLKESGEDDRSLRLLEEVLKIEPDNAYAMNNLAYELFLRGQDLERALKLAKVAYAKLPDSAAILDTVQRISEKINQKQDKTNYRNAKERLLSMMQEEPNNMRARFEYVNLVRSYGERELAKGVLEEILTKEPENMRAKFDLVSLVKSMGDHSVAQSLLEEILSKEPNNMRAKLELSRLSR